MTNYLLILSIMIWPFGQLLNFQVPGALFTFYPLDIICAFLTLSLLFSSKSRKSIYYDPLFKPLFLFLLVALISLLLNLNSAINSGLAYPIFYLIRLFIYPSVYFAAKVYSSKKIFPYVLLSLLFFSFLGLLQYLLIPDMRFLKNLGFDDHYYRLIGPFFDPNFTGAILAGVSLVLVALNQWLVAIPTILLLALTFSRASYLVFFLGLLYLAFTSRKWSLLILLVLLATLVALIPKPFGEGVNLWRTFSVFSRFDSWHTGLSLFLQKPLFGWGYNTLRSLTGQRFQIDNSYLYIAATTGIVGLLTFFNLLKHLLNQLRPFAPKIFIFAILSHSLFNNSLFYIWIYFAFWLVSGLSAKEYKES